MKSIRCYIEVCLVKDLIDDSGQIVPASQIIESTLLKEYETVEFTDEQYEYLLAAYRGGQLFTLDELREDFIAINKRLTLPRLDYINKLYKQHDLSAQLEKLKYRIYAFVTPILDDKYELMFRSDYEYKVKDDVVYRHYGDGKKSIVLCLNKNITYFASDAEIVEERAFHRCQYLKEVNLHKVEEIQEGAFCGCLSLSCIKLSDVLTEIGNDAFMGCHFLKEIMLPNSLEHIGEMAFCDTPLEYLSDKCYCVARWRR